MNTTLPTTERTEAVPDRFWVFEEKSASPLGYLAIDNTFRGMSGGGIRLVPTMEIRLPQHPHGRGQGGNSERSR